MGMFVRVYQKRFSTDDTPTGSAASDGAGRWDAFARALSDEATVIADRDDLLVTVAPGAGHGAPACFLPATATIELDARSARWCGWCG